MITTPPQELFRELTDLGNLMFSMLVGPQVQVRHWPAYYMAYLDLARLCWELSRTTGHLARGFSTADDTVDGERINDVNAGLARVDGILRTLVSLLAQMEGQGLVSHGKPALKNVVDKHFSPTSAWYAAFQEHYCSGRVTADGRILGRNTLLIDSHPAFAQAGTAEKTLVERQTFELVSAQSRALLARTARSVQTKLNQVLAALGRFFADHCPSVSALLHPSMIWKAQ